MHRTCSDGERSERMSKQLSEIIPLGLCECDACIGDKVLMQE